MSEGMWLQDFVALLRHPLGAGLVPNLRGTSDGRFALIGVLFLMYLQERGLKIKLPQFSELWKFLEGCDPNRIQTCNLLIRSQMLYSVELWGLLSCQAALISLVVSLNCCDFLFFDTCLLT